MSKPVTGFSRRIVFARDYASTISETARTTGRTDRYSTGVAGLDRFIFGGYGQHGLWEIVVIHAEPGVGKSTLGLKMLSDPIKRGIPVGIMALEDDPRKVVFRLNSSLGGSAVNVSQAIQSNRIRLIPQESLERLWTFDELLNEIETWFTEPNYNVDIILLDHLQFAFDSALLGEEKDQWRAQSNFMFRLNVLMKKLKDKTIILVSQQNKHGQIAGGAAIPRAASKILKIEKVDHDPSKRAIMLEKTRDTPEASGKYIVEMTGGTIDDTKEQPGFTTNL